MVKDPHFQCRGVGSIPGWGTKIPHARWYSRKKKRKKPNGKEQVLRILEKLRWPGKSSALGSIPGLGRSSGGGNGNPLQYSCLENSMDGGAWLATVHGVSKSLKQLSVRAHTHTHTQFHLE